MVQGSGQMGELSARRRRRRRHLEIGVWNSFSFRAWIGLIWEISAWKLDHSAWNFGARLFCKNPKNQQKSYFQYFQDIRKFQETCSKNNPRQHNTTPGAARPPPPARRPYFQDTRQSEKPDLQYFQATRKLENFNFQYFQATRKLEKSNFQYFQDRRKSKKSNFQYFQDYR